MCVTAMPSREDSTLQTCLPILIAFFFPAPSSEMCSKPLKEGWRKMSHLKLIFHTHLFMTVELLRDYVNHFPQQ